jgi:electron transport complex protein RnfG
MNQLFKFGFILCVICFAATLILAVTYQITKPRIDEQLKAEEQKALNAIIPEADSFEKRTAGDIEYFEARKGAAVTGYCVRVTGNGYNGFVRIVVGIDPEGMIRGVQVLEHQETPGLGARINEIKPGETDAWFLRQFKGKPVRTIEVKKDIDAITGATISSKAVTDAIRNTVTRFLAEMEKGK